MCTDMGCCCRCLYITWSACLTLVTAVNPAKMTEPNAMLFWKSRHTHVGPCAKCLNIWAPAGNAIEWSKAVALWAVTIVSSNLLLLLLHVMVLCWCWGCAMSGLIADSRTLIDKARVEAQVLTLITNRDFVTVTYWFLYWHTIYCVSDVVLFLVPSWEMYQSSKCVGVQIRIWTLSESVNFGKSEIRQIFRIVSIRIGFTFCCIKLLFIIYCCPSFAVYK